MIKVTMSDLPVEKIKKIREWLEKEECLWMAECVASEIAEMQATLTNLPLCEPHRTIGDPNAFPPDSVGMMKQAAILQTFLNVLAKMRSKDTKFQTAKLTLS